MKIVLQVISFIGKFLGPAVGSIKGHLNIEELLKTLVTAVLAGGGILGVLTALIPVIGVIVPNAADAALATGVLTVIVDVVRRLQHGTAPPTPSPKTFR